MHITTSLPCQKSSSDANKIPDLMAQTRVSEAEKKYDIFPLIKEVRTHHQTVKWIHFEWSETTGQKKV